MPSDSDEENNLGLKKQYNMEIQNDLAVLLI